LKCFDFWSIRTIGSISKQHLRGRAERSIPSRYTATPNNPHAIQEFTMEAKVNATVPGAVLTTSAPRPTPVPAKVPFKEIMSKTLAATSQVAMSVIPGAPLMAFALRGGSSAAVPSISSSLNPGNGAAAASAASAEGPSPTSAGAGGSGSSGAGGGLESSIAQSQEMNLYYLQIQEQVNAQNRSFTTLSNVMKAEHETVKTAIGNIR
jgi:hypothetical protein